MAIVAVGLCLCGGYLTGYPVDLDVFGLGTGACAVILMVVGGLCGAGVLFAWAGLLSKGRSVVARVFGFVAFLGAVAMFGITCIVGFLFGGFAPDDVWYDLGTAADGRHLIVQEGGFTHPYAQFAELDGITVTRLSGMYFLPKDADPLGGDVRLTGPSGARVLRWTGDHGGLSVNP